MKGLQRVGVGESPISINTMNGLTSGDWIKVGTPGSPVIEIEYRPLWPVFEWVGFSIPIWGGTASNRPLYMSYLCMGAFFMEKKEEM